MTLQQLIDQIGTAANIPPQTAEAAAGTILSVIYQELDPAQATAIFSKLPGASDLAMAHPVQANSGVLASIAGAVLGNKGAIAAAGLSQLQGLGLSTSQIASLGAALKGFLAKNGGSGALTEIVNAIPGLGHILG